MRPAIALALLSALAVAADRDEFKIKRQEVFEFAEKPAVSRNGDQVTIRFAAKGLCDATVAIEDAAGRIIRHLASGVLGEKAPVPFQKGSLTQAVVWDGKDDLGRYVDDKDALTVRVSLGLKPVFERTLFWSPHKRIGDRPPLMAPVEEGVVAFDGLGVDHVRLFDHQGNYVRTIYPFPADRLDRVVGLRWQTFPQDGQRLPLKDGFVQGSLLTSGTSGMSDAEKHQGGIAATAMAAHGNRIALVYDRLNRLATDGTTGGLPLAGPKTGFEGRISKDHKDTLLVGPTSAAFSPDGRWLYLTGHIWTWLVGGWNPQSGWFNVVLRLEFAKDDDAQVFLGSPKQWETGTGHDDFKMPTSVVCDAQGRLYVADYLNDRIQVFDADGKFLKTLAASRPASLQLHRRTARRLAVPQELLVFSWPLPGDKRFQPAVARFGPFPAFRKLASCELPVEAAARSLSSSGQDYAVALDAWTDPPTLWMVARRALWQKSDVSYWGTGIVTKAAEDPWLHAGIKLLAERDGKWNVLRNFAQDVKDAVVRVKPPDFSRQRLLFNPRDRLLYVAEDRGFGKSFCELVRLDPASGKIDLVPLPFDAEDMCFDLEGLAYLRTDTLVARYDSQSWREVPWDYGEERQNVFFDSMTGGKPVKKVIAGLATPGSRPVCWHQGGMWVSATGHLAVACCSRAAPPAVQDWKAHVKTQEGKPYAPMLYPGRVRWNEIHVWDKHGQLVCEDAFPGMTQVNGVFIDERDALTVMASPARILDGEKYFNEMSGTLIKVRPRQAKVIGTSGHAPLPISAEGRPSRPPDVYNSHLGTAWVEGADWMYGGVGYCGFNPARAGGGCDCWHSRFAADYFNRSFAPEVGHYSVAVLDTNGNLILRVGRYGNVEDGRPLIAAGGPKATRPLGGDEVALFHAAYLGVDTDRRLFIADAGNGRIVSVKLGYHAEERIALRDVRDEGR